ETSKWLAQSNSTCGGSGDEFSDCSLHRTKRVALLAAVVIEQSFGHRLQIARENGVELVERQTDAMIGKTILGVIVRADPLAAVARADQRFAFVGSLLVLFFAL